MVKVLRIPNQVRILSVAILAITAQPGHSFYNCRNFLRYIFRMESSDELSNVAPAKIPYVEINSGSKVLVKVIDDDHEYFIFGVAKKIKIFEDYEVLELTDEQGNVHLFDKSSEYYLVDSKNRNKISKLPGPIKKREVHLEIEELREKLCRSHARLESSPQFKSALSAATRHLMSNPSQIKHLSKRMLASCAASIGLPLIGGYYTADKREKKLDDWISNHQSNFTESVMIMGFIHSCIGAMGKSWQNEVLLMGTGAMLAGNIYSEIGFGQNKGQGFFAQPVGSPLVSDENTSKKVTTDLPDLAAGVSGIVAYTLLVKGIESSMGYKMSLLCKK